MLTENYSAPQIAKTNAYSASEMESQKCKLNQLLILNQKVRSLILFRTLIQTIAQQVGINNWRYAVPSNVPKTYTLSYLLNKGILTTKVVNGKTYYKAK